MQYKSPYPTVDIIIEKNNKVVLIKRKNEPFRNMLAIPGGFVEYGETVEHAAVREAKEETGLKIKLIEILGVYSIPTRDPRKHTLGTEFIAKPLSKKLKASTDAKEAKWYSLNEIKSKKLSFDHAQVIKDYMKWKKNKGTYWSTL
jgi:8-oxo-dGTP diphosphatase